MSAASDPSPRIPDHELLRRVGRGSYGEIWLARNVMGSLRAVKVVYRASFDSDRPYEREFSGLQEFEPISRTHPGLVSILHVGRNSDAKYFYCVMEIADDVSAGPMIQPESYQPRTLASELAKRGRLPLRECLELAIALAAALGHLHSHSLVHRDLKPSNIIFVNGQPKLADIGLVTKIGAKATFVGTEGYLPPEGPGSPSADLYGLGRVLYEISMGKPQDDFPELPTDLHEFPEAPALMRLNAIVLKACDSNPAKRFRSAEDLRTAVLELRSEAVGIWSRVSATSPGHPVSGLRIAILSGATNPREAALARLLRERLSAEGFAVWVDDQADLSVSWARRMEQEVRCAHALIALLSAASVRNEMTAYALEIAHQTARGPAGLPALLPVAIELKDAVPRHVAVVLKGTSPIETTADADQAQIIEKVITALTARFAPVPSS
jgi:serine/threonine protein kinase